MSTFFKIAFMATLVLNALLGLDKLQGVRAEFRKFTHFVCQQTHQACTTQPTPVPQVSQWTSNSNSSKVTFEPTPNDPPTTTGGTGTR